MFLRVGHVLGFLMLGAAALAQPCFAQKGPESITVATWNLEWFFDDYRGDNESDLSKEQSAPDRENWEWKKSVVAEAIAKFRPTILAVQEIENRRVLMDLCQILEKKHSLPYRVAFIEGFDRATEQDVGILYLSGLVEYSRREQTKSQFDSKQYYNITKHLFGQFEWEVNGRTEKLTILNVHFRAKAEEAATRLKQSKLARLWMQDRIRAGENVIFIGDTNFEELAGQGTAGGELQELTGKGTPDTNDDLVDVLERVPENARRTHMILEKQFDRIMVSQSLLDDDAKGTDLVLEKVEVLPQHNIRGSGPDMDHWDTRYTKPFPERDISDHYPVMATFRFR